ncbi:MAG: hypothetical protein ABI680_00970 [Chthoniobacteraceae bacterium]
MRSARLTLLLNCLATLLFVAVLGQSLVQKAEAVFVTCASEHQDHDDHPDSGQDDGSHCPCWCHHLQTALVELQLNATLVLGVVSMVEERGQLVVEAPRASIDYPPQLA